MPDKATDDPMVSSALQPLASVATFLAISVSTIVAAEKFLEALSRNALITVSVLYLAVGSVVWNIRLLKLLPYHDFIHAYRIRIISTLTLLFMLAMFAPPMWHRIIQPTFFGVPAKPPRFGSLMGSAAHAAEPKLVLDSFYIDDRQSSFSTTGESGLRTFSYNNRVADAFRRADCIGPKGKGYIRAILPLLQKRLRRLGLTQYSYAVEDYEAYKRMIAQSGGVFDKIIFNQAEFDEMRRENSGDYKTVQEYLVNCAGMRDPVFVFVVSNRGDESLVLSKVKYEVARAYTSLGGTAKLLEPISLENHSIPHGKGKYERVLSSPLLLEPSSTARIDIRLRSETEGVGQTWEMSIALEGQTGTGISTGLFKLIMSK